MPRILKDADLPDLIRRYGEGVPLRTLAEEAGVQAQSLRVRLQKAGVRMRTLAASKRLHFPPVDAAALAVDYCQGESVNALAKRLGISRTAVGRLLSPYVQLRGQSEAERTKWRRMDAPARARQTAAAHLAASALFAGKPPSLASMEGKSRAWQAAPRFTVWESAVYGMLQGLGIPCIPQYTVGTYNLDFAVAGLPVAVEVITSYVSPAYGPKLRHKVESLLHGWHIVFVVARCPGHIAGIRAALPAWLDRARRDKAMVGHYGVIHSQPQRATGLERYLHGLPLVLSPHGSVDDAPDPLAG